MAAFVIFITIIGPELVFYFCDRFVTSRVTPFPRNHGSNFEQHKTAFEEGAGQDDAIIEDVHSPEKDKNGSVHDIKQIEIEKV